MTVVESADLFGNPSGNFSIGFPYSGVTINGTMTLPITGDPTVFFEKLSNSNTFSNESKIGCIVNDKITLPTRTTEQLAYDAALGREHKPYALIASGNAWGKARVRDFESVYVDSRGYPWLISWQSLVFDQGDSEIRGSVNIRRFAHMGRNQDHLQIGQTSPITVSILETGVDFRGAIATAVGTGNGSPSMVDQTRNGDRVLFFRTAFIAEATITDTITEIGSDTYPYNNGTIAFNISFEILKTNEDTFTFYENTFDTLDPGYYHFKASTGLWEVNATPATSYDEFYNETESQTAHSSQIIHAAYDENDLVVYFEIDQVMSYSSTLTFAGAVATSSSNREYTTSIKRNGITVDSYILTLTTDSVATVTAGSGPGLFDVEKDITNTMSDGIDTLTFTETQNVVDAVAGDGEVQPGPRDWWDNAAALTDDFRELWTATRPIELGSVDSYWEGSFRVSWFFAHYSRTEDPDPHESLNGNFNIYYNKLVMFGYLSGSTSNNVVTGSNTFEVEEIKGSGTLISPDNEYSLITGSVTLLSRPPAGWNPYTLEFEPAPTETVGSDVRYSKVFFV